MIFFSQHFQECFHNVFQVQRSSPHSCEILFAFHLFDPICLWKVRWWKWGVWRACLKVHSLGLISRLTAAICGSSSGFHAFWVVGAFEDLMISTFLPPVGEAWPFNHCRNKTEEHAIESNRIYLSNKNSSGSQHFHYHAYVQIRRLNIIYFFSSTCTASFDIHVDIALHTSSPFACTLVPFDENRRSVSQRSEAKACSLATPYFVSER